MMGIISCRLSVPFVFFQVLPSNRFSFFVSFLLVGLSCVVLSGVTVTAQNSHELYAGRNINMVSGTRQPGETDPQRVALGGDPYLQRQNEPSVAVSTRNPMHLLAGANDYRSVNLPGLPADRATGDAWLGLFKSFDGGQSWQSTLLPGFPQAVTSQEGVNSPIHGFAAAADPTVRSGNNGMFYYSGIAFNRGIGALGALFVARLIDLNNKQGSFFDVPANKDPIKHLDTKIIDSGTAGQFVDKPWIAVDIPRSTATVTITATDPDAPGGTVSQKIPCGNVYIAYSIFTGDTSSNVRSKIMFSRSTDCGSTWAKPIMIDQSFSACQGTFIAIDPKNPGTLYVAWRVFKSSSNPDSIVIVKSTDYGQRFSKPREVSAFVPFDQGTRPVSSEDPFRAFRTNAYPTMTVDDWGTVYVAWAQRGMWGNDNLQPTDGVMDGSRIVISSSRDGVAWSSPKSVEAPSGSAAHQIMPSLSFVNGKLALLFLDFRDDFYPSLWDRILTNSDKSGALSSMIPYDPSMPLADAAAFDPLPVRHTADVRVAHATPGHPPVFEGSSKKVSRYLIGIAPDPNSVGNYVSYQLQSNPVNLPLFAGGTSPFMGDYIDLVAAPAVNSSDATVLHAVWTDNRNVALPPYNQNDVNGLPRTDWTQYSAPGTCVGFPGVRNQDIYTSRISQGLVVGSFGNFKPLNVERGFSFFVENTTPVEASSLSGTPRPPTKRFQLTVTSPAGVEASFTPFSLGASSSLEIEVQNLSRVAETVFARCKPDVACNTKASLTVRVQEIDPISKGPTGLQSTLILNPDPTNPDPLNLDQDNNAVSSKETHDPQFLSFTCSDFASLGGTGVVSNCLGAAPQPTVSTLMIQWPALADPRNPALLNPALLNTAQNPALLNPALLNPALLNPALLNPALLNPALLNPALLNPALLNPALLNPALLNPALLNPALLNPALLNPALLNPALLNTAILNPALLNPALLNPALLNPALLNPALLNSAPSGTDLTNAAYSTALVQGSILVPSDATPPKNLTDLTWQVTNIGNDASSYFFTWFTALNQRPSQLIIYRTYKTSVLDQSCHVANNGLLENGLHYEFLANILDPALLQPAQLKAALTFSLAPSDIVFVTLRFHDPVDSSSFAGRSLQQAPNTGEKAATSTFLSAAPNPAVYGQIVTLTATVVSPAGIPTGMVLFKVDGNVLGSATVDGAGKASVAAASLYVGAHTVTADYIPSGNFKLSTAQSLLLTVNPAPLTVTANNATKTYGQTMVFTGTEFTTSGLVYGDTVTGVTLTSTGAPATAAVGSYAIVPSAATGTGLANYMIRYNNGTLTINKLGITVTADAKSKVYGEPDPALTYTFTPALATGDNFSGVLTRVAGENVGTYAVQQGTLALSGNYTLTYVGSDLTIIKKTVTVTADAKSKVYGEPDPALTYTFTPALVAGDSFTGALSREGGENVGTYAIQQGTLALSGNYSLIYVGAHLLINKAWTSVTLSLSTNSSIVGQMVTLTSQIAVVAPGSGVPIGTVSFKDGNTVIGVGALDTKGQATLAISTLVVGLHSLVAEYNGDSNFVASVSGSVAFGVRYDFIGFRSPLGPADTGAVYGPLNLGSAVAVKWQLKDFNGAFIGDLSTVVSMHRAANTDCQGPPEGEPALLYPDATGTTILRFGDNQYIFNWDTTGSAAGCYSLFLKLNDETLRSIIVLLK
ncbi:MAG: Ig-like domain repeat protein [Acidobacteria bacterium]|nr:Ig-like domain repeat protein [Acidobacteriota bacterium]